MKKERKERVGLRLVNLKERNACELGWVFLIPDEEMLSGGLEMSLQPLLPCFAWLWSDEQTSGVLSGGVRRGASEILVSGDQLVSLETVCGIISSFTYSKSKMFLSLASFCLSV